MAHERSVAVGNAVGALSQVRRKYDAFTTQAAHEAKGRKEMMQRLRQSSKQSSKLQSPAVRKVVSKHKVMGKNTWNSVFPGRNGRQQLVS